MKKLSVALLLLVLAATLLLSACGGPKFEYHKVTFDADGGTLNRGDDSATVRTYGNVDLPIPTKEGYVFLGWFVGEGINESQFTATSMVTADITLKAKWIKAEYTVTFLDYYGNVISRDTVKHGEAANAPTVPRVEEKCLRFDAWDVDISSVTADMEVKALYVIDAYTVTYVTGNSQTIPPSSYFFDEIPKAPLSPGLSGHYFIGWYLDEAFEKEYTFDKPLTENITLYAYFNESIPISDVEELIAIPDYSAENYFLKNDIDCEGAVITRSIKDFAGIFDGEGHKIHNFVFQPESAESTGLFSANSGTIKNVTFDNFSYTLTQTNLNSNTGFLIGTNTGAVENAHITNASLSYTGFTKASVTYFNGTYSFRYGGIAGDSSGMIDGCSVTGTTLYFEARTLSGAYGTANTYLYVSPIVGINGGTMNDCTSDTTVTLYHDGDTSSSYSKGNITNTRLGGIASVNNGTLCGCEAKISVTASSNNYETTESLIGGIVYGNNSEIENCSADAKITLNGTFTYISAAGFAEMNAGSIKNCYAAAEIANVNSIALLGGFVSYNTGGISKCYVSGSINAGAAKNGKGGFAGYNNGSINSCFSDVSISATDGTYFSAFIGHPDTASYTTACYYGNNATFTLNNEPHIFDETFAEAVNELNFADSDFLGGQMGWSEELWEFDPNKFEFPTLK